MPIYEYEPFDDTRSCDYCRAGFEQLRRMSDPPLTACPKCGAPVRKKISAPAVGSSASGLDDRAKSAGFSKLKRIGKGEYEKQY
jgi:putative FmdB family regulatory protein